MYGTGLNNNDDQCFKKSQFLVYEWSTAKESLAQADMENPVKKSVSPREEYGA